MPTGPIPNITSLIDKIATGEPATRYATSMIEDCHQLECR
jgi:hypothetical protein